MAERPVVLTSDHFPRSGKYQRHVFTAASRTVEVLFLVRLAFLSATGGLSAEAGLYPLAPRFFYSLHSALRNYWLLNRFDHIFDGKYNANARVVGDEFLEEFGACFRIFESVWPRDSSVSRRE